MFIKIRPFAQILFLLLFIVAMVTGKIQIWMVVFIGSFLLAFLLGRFFCGFICPINTLMEVVDRLYKKLGVKRRSNLGWLKSPVFKYGMLIVFLSLLAVFMVTGSKMPLLPVVALLGVLVTLVFIPSLWHRYLCPFGTALTLPGCFSVYRLLIDYEKCNKCGICKKVCPGEAVKIGQKGDYPVINKTHCLNCLVCVKACPQEAIFYGRTEKKLDETEVIAH